MQQPTGDQSGKANGCFHVWNRNLWAFSEQKTGFSELVGCGIAIYLPTLLNYSVIKKELVAFGCWETTGLIYLKTSEKGIGKNLSKDSFLTLIKNPVSMVWINRIICVNFTFIHGPHLLPMVSILREMGWLCGAPLHSPGVSTEVPWLRMLKT